MAAKLLATKLLQTISENSNGLITSGKFQFTYDDDSVLTKYVDITGYAVGSRNLSEIEWDSAVSLVNTLNRQ